MMQKLPGAPVVLGVGLGIAALTAYLRMAAEAALPDGRARRGGGGSLVGWGVPYLFHRPRQGSAPAGTVTPTASGIADRW